MSIFADEPFSFLANGSEKQFRYCYKMYPRVWKIQAIDNYERPEKLIRLDKWYQSSLPKIIRARGKNPYIVRAELEKIMLWLHVRRELNMEFRPTEELNTAVEVIAETRRAFNKLPNLREAITVLVNMKAVNTPLASAILTAACPEYVPFMADECLMAIPEIKGLRYTTKNYLQFVKFIKAGVKRLNRESGGNKRNWTPHRVELALWAHYTCDNIIPSMLVDMPSCDECCELSMINGSANNYSASDEESDKE